MPLLLSCFSHATAREDPITKQSYSARNLRRGVVCTPAGREVVRGRKKEVCAQDIYEVRVIFQSEKKFPMLSSSIAAASCQRKLKLDNSSCRFSFATSVQKNCQATKKIIYVFYRYTQAG